MTRKPFLRVTKSNGLTDETITKFELTYGVSVGIQWGAIGIGMVPIFEEQSARLERGYTMEEWYKLPMMERAMIIAIRRLDIAAKNLQAEEEIREMKRKQNQGK